MGIVKGKEYSGKRCTITKELLISKPQKIKGMEESTIFDFYKNKSSDTIFWVDTVGVVGEHLFSFDKKKIFNLFADYPHNLSESEKKIFDKENPYWKEFFKDQTT